ncbi:MAG: hydroxymethylglutaryl-CoA lyase [Candidatus Micropelagos sp.]|nr:hydroxymethylglutaryl-CoA lyase [Candidatus Micropelagos sp.]
MSDNFIFVNDVGPRDGLQNQAIQVEPETRITLIQKLLDAGVPGVEVASFVSPKAVPRMAGAGEIVTALKDSPAALSALVPNLKGYEMARDSGAKIISVVPSATETMNRKNINMGYEDILALSCDLMKRAKDDGIKGQAYVSVAFECPFEGQVSQDRVMEMTETLLEAGAQEIIIADTIGAANPSQVKSLFDRLTASFDKKILATHFHDTRAMGLANAYAAIECGIRKFDASIGGLGGCPFAPGAAGNLATEDLVSMAHQMGFETGIDEKALLGTSNFAGEIIGQQIGGRMAGWMAYQMSK